MRSGPSSSAMIGPEVPMGAVQLSDELERVIEQQVAEGRAKDQAAFLEEAVMRLVDDHRAEDEDIRRAIATGTADADAGHYTTIATPQDRDRLQARVTA